MRPPADAAGIEALARRLSLLAFRVGSVAVHHFDFYSQALSKVERGFAHDLEDVRMMLASGRVEPGRLRELFEAIRDDFARYPAVDVDVLERRLREATGG